MGSDYNSLMTEKVEHKFLLTVSLIIQSNIVTMPIALNVEKLDMIILAFFLIVKETLYII